MTFPLYVCAHVLYGVLMAHAMERRLRSEGEILGLPLVATLVPIAFVSTPLGAVLLRWAGGWFLHGALIDGESIAYERFHLGLMVLVGVAAGIATVAGLFVSIAALSRDARRFALAPAGIALAVTLLVLILDAGDVIEVAGTGGRRIWTHPVGLVSLALVAGLLGAWAFARARLSAPVDVRP